MIDVHSHVLPGIDDGSQSSEESRQLLEESARQGVTHIAATPHFYAAQESFDRFLEKREHALSKILEKREGWGEIPRLFIGAEVYYFPGMGKADRLKELCYKDTDLLLLEMPFAQWDDQVVRDVENIIRKQKLTVILAHIERYYEFQKKKAFWDEVFDMPVIPQMNTGAFMGKRKHLCIKLMKKYGPTLLGSDCHNPIHRAPNLAAGREVIEKKFGQGMLERIDEMSRKILTEREGIVIY